MEAIQGRRERVRGVARERRLTLTLTPPRPCGGSRTKLANEYEPPLARESQRGARHARTPAGRWQARSAAAPRHPTHTAAAGTGVACWQGRGRLIADRALGAGIAV